MLKFVLNSTEYFIIILKTADDIIDCCYRTPIILNCNNDQVVIANEDIQEYAERLYELLQLALFENLKLHPSIQKDLGYYWNEDMNKSNPDLFYEQSNDCLGWIGTKYLLWSTSFESPQQFGTWCYNNTDGDIIFEITPIYPKTFVNKENSAEVNAYQEWMKNSYKPFFTRIISKNLAEQWLKQAKLILKTIR